MVKCSARRCGNTHEGGFVMTCFSEDEERSAAIDPDIPSDKKVQLEVKQLNRKPKLTGDPVSAASVSCHMVSKHSVQTNNKARKDASSTKDIFKRISEPDNKAENCEMSPAKTEESAKQKNKKLKRQIREMKLALRKNKALVKKHLEIVSVLKLCRELRESADLDVTKSNG